MQADDPRIQVGQNTYAANDRLSENAKTKTQRWPDQTLAISFSAAPDGDKGQESDDYEHKCEQSIGKLNKSMDALLWNIG
jgi:hypothetical protein